MAAHPSLAGYSEEAEKLIVQYEQLPFERVFANFLHAFPAAPCRALDIGGGTGRHAAGLARHGHDVVAVEPTRELREAGQALHAGVPLTWVDDTLPGLEKFRQGLLAGPYGLILLAAVLMHFDAEEQTAIIRRVSTLLSPGGRCVISLRHGPVPEGRRMFEIPDEEIAALAEQHGMACVCRASGSDHDDRPGIRWTMLCLEKM